MTLRMAILFLFLFGVIVVGAAAMAGCSVPITAANATIAPVVNGTPVSIAPTAPLVRDRGIPYYDKADGVPTIIYDPAGDEDEVRFAIQIEKSLDAVILDPIKYEDPRSRLACRLHNGGGGIVHVTVVRPGGINYYAIPA